MLSCNTVYFKGLERQECGVLDLALPVWHMALCKFIRLPESMLPRFWIEGAGGHKESQTQMSVGVDTNE